MNNAYCQREQRGNRMGNDEIVFDPEEFRKRMESDDFDPSNLMEEDKRKLAMMRFFSDAEEGVTVTFTPYE